MIREKLFKDVMNSFIAYRKWLDKLNDLGINIAYLDEENNFEDKFIELINYCCNEEYDTIGYFCWETNFGEEADKYYITDVDGTEYKLHNVDELWDYLKKFNQNIEDLTEEPKKASAKEEPLNNIQGQLSVEDLQDIFLENFSK